jgi:hypothetical protein
MQWLTIRRLRVFTLMQSAKQTTKAPAPTGNGAVLNSSNMCVLQLREVGNDVAGGPLACRAEAFSRGIVVKQDANVECLLVRGEWDGGPILVGAGLPQLERWHSVLPSDGTPDRELVQARGLYGAPGNPVGLCELGMTAAHSDMVGKHVNASGESERGNGEQRNTCSTLTYEWCKAGRCQVMVVLHCNTRGVLIGKRA